MFIVKINELAEEFYNLHGMRKLIKMLDNECLRDYQLSYNVLTSLWILSFHDYGLADFEDVEQDLIEKSIKVLDFFNKEKVVRMCLMLMTSLSSSKLCLEIMSDLNCLELVQKLQQRHWVDQDIKDMLEKLWEKFDENYQEFTSIGKFAKEVHSRSLRWGPVHTERFWQENFIHFNDTDNLALIKELVHIVESSDNERTIAVALYDLGEFAKYFKFGRSYLDQLGLKKIIYRMMQQTDSADIKKEAITTLQKLIVTGIEN